jgi:hypothetical protein
LASAGRQIEHYLRRSTITVSGVVAGIDSKLCGGTHTAADVVAKAQAVLSEPELLRAMFDVG